MSDTYGIGLPEIKPKLTVYMPFFIQAILPHHMKRGEVLKQDILIFNYLSNGQTVTVSVKRNDAQFEVLKPDFDGWKGKKYLSLIKIILNIVFQLLLTNIGKISNRFQINRNYFAL